MTTVTRVHATFADATTSLLLDIRANEDETVGKVKTTVRTKLAKQLEANWGLDHRAVFHPNDNAIYIDTSADTTIKKPFPDSTLISDLVNGNSDYLTAVVLGPSMYPCAKGPLAMIYPLEPKLVDISTLNKTMHDLTATTKQLRDEAAELRKEAAASEQRLEEREQKLRKEAAVSEKKLRKEAAASEKKLRKEATASERRLRKEAAATEEMLTDKVADTEQRLSINISALKDELDKEKDEHQHNLDCIRDLTVQLMPLHLRVLLDEARKKILQKFGYESWDDLTSRLQAPYDLFNSVFKEFQGSLHAPSEDAVKLICTYNNVRRDGNEAAHSATKDQVKQAVMSKIEGGEERHRLEQVFEFTYDVDMYE